jgi:MshEN domain
MGLLGRLFGGSDKREPKDLDQRSKRGRAPSIRQVPSAADEVEADEAPLPEINLDDIDQQQAAAKAPAVDQSLDPIPVDFESPAAPPPTPVEVAPPPAMPRVPTPAPAPAAQPPRKGTTVRRVATPDSPRATRRSTRLQSRQKPLGEILIKSEAVSTEQLTRALKIQDKGGKGLVGQILVNMGACQPTQIAQALGRQFRISTIELDRVEVPPEIAALIPEETCRQHRLIPFEKLGKMLCLSMANCLNRKAIDEVEESTKLRVKPFNCSWIEIREAIESVYSQDAVREAAAANAAAAAAGAGQEDNSQKEATAQAEAVARELAAEGGVELPPELAGEIDVSDVAPDTPAASEEDEQLRPFSGPARAVIEGLDDLDDGDAEEVRTTDRGLASRHLEAIQARREERAKVMGTSKGVVGKLIAPDLDDFSPDAFDEGPEVIDFREAQETEIAGAELPVAEELAASVAEFAEKNAPAIPEETFEEEAEPVAEAPEVALAVEEEELIAAHDGEAEHADEPQAQALAAAEAVAQELPAVPAIAHAAKEQRDMEAIPLSDKEWAKMEAEMELDPVVAWAETYAAAGPVPARASLI